MEITKLGDGGFKIKGKKTILLIDPPSDAKNLTAHIVILCASRRKDWNESIVDPEIKVKGEPVLIFGPGEYEIREARIFGLKDNKGIIYKIEMDGLSILHLNHLQEKLSEEKVETLGDVDIIFLPLDKPKLASYYLSQLEPLVVIPLEEKGIDGFLKEEGIERVERLSEVVVTKDALPEERKIVVLKEA